MNTEHSLSSSKSPSSFSPLITSQTTLGRLAKKEQSQSLRFFHKHRAFFILLLLLRKLETEHHHHHESAFSASWRVRNNVYCRHFQWLSETSKLCNNMLANPIFFFLKALNVPSIINIEIVRSRETIESWKSHPYFTAGAVVLVMVTVVKMIRWWW